MAAAAAIAAVDAATRFWIRATAAAPRIMLHNLSMSMSACICVCGCVAVCHTCRCSGKLITRLFKKLNAFGPCQHATPAAGSWQRRGMWQRGNVQHSTSDSFCQFECTLSGLSWGRNCHSCLGPLRNVSLQRWKIKRVAWQLKYLKR